jgi:RNA-directed DNA polymerase
VDERGDGALGLTINEAKTSVKKAETESFDFLGYTFGALYHGRTGQRYLGASPSMKSRKRIKTKISQLLRPGEKAPWPAVRQRLNRLLAGWSAYFDFGASRDARQAVDRHVSERVRAFLTRRTQASGSGTRTFSWNAIFGQFGVLKLRIPKPPKPAHAP